jgi:hypothetical protein
LAFDRNKAFEIRDDGLAIEGGAHISSGTGDPAHTGLAGDLYFKTSDGSEWFLAADGAVWIPRKVIRRMTVAQSSTVIAPAAITQLTTPSLPVGSYRFQAIIKIRSAAAATGYGLRFQNAGATVSDILAQWRLPANADFSTTHNIVYSQRDQTINNVAGTIGAANTDYAAVGEGFFTISAAGAVTIQLRSETAGTAVTAGIGSFFRVERL